MGLKNVLQEKRDSLACPKPGRFSSVATTEMFEMNGTVDLVDLFYTKVGVADQGEAFFCGSPPMRTGNPVVGDPLFGAVNPMNSLTLGSPKSPMTSSRNVFARPKTGLLPAALRVEGFDCRSHGRDGQNGVSASA